MLEQIFIKSFENFLNENQENGLYLNLIKELKKQSTNDIFLIEEFDSFYYDGKLIKLDKNYFGKNIFFMSIYKILIPFYITNDIYIKDCIIFSPLGYEYRNLNKYKDYSTYVAFDGSNFFTMSHSKSFSIDSKINVTNFIRSYTKRIDEFRIGSIGTFQDLISCTYSAIIPGSKNFIDEKRKEELYKRIDRFTSKENDFIKQAYKDVYEDEDYNSIKNFSDLFKPFKNSFIHLPEKGYEDIYRYIYMVSPKMQGYI